MKAGQITQRFDVLAFTGRFQPFHCDHLAMVRYALERAAHVVVGVTNPDPVERTPHPASAHRHLSRANPFSYAQREALIAAALRADGIAADRFSILPFPLEDPACWPALLPPGTPQLVRIFSDWEREKLRRFEAAGYPTLALQGDIAARICASDVRVLLERGEPWSSWVPPGARELLFEWQSAGLAHGG